MNQAGPVENSRAPLRVLRIRTDDWPLRDRVEMFRELRLDARKADVIPDYPY